ncbi:TPA: hypothetical protein ACXPT9_004943 [Bacillus cereus]|nr:hypothetical protein [Bacillus anthracis]
MKKILAMLLLVVTIILPIQHDNVKADKHYKEPSVSTVQKMVDPGTG